MAKYPNKPNLPAVVKPTQQTVQPNQLVKATGLVKVPRPSVPYGACAVYEDSPRYKFGFGVASATSGRIYKISFDTADGALYWKCSCPSCITRGYCKHLTACGLKGRADMSRAEGLAFAKRHGIIQ